MGVFTFYFEDRRYTVPTLEFVIVRDRARAVALAQQRLDLSENYLSVEVCLDGAPLFSIGRASGPDSDAAIGGKAPVADRPIRLARRGEHRVASEIGEQMSKAEPPRARSMTAGPKLMAQLRSMVAAARTISPPRATD